MARAYYNEIDPFAAQWLRNLIAAGHIAPGDVDERDIRDIKPSELRGYTQCHFFAGIGIWSLALRMAGWPDDRQVWSGSCPRQPFSAAGKGNGFADERHLWPAFLHLIEAERPRVVFGEQVASRDGLAWLDLVQSDLERANYASAAIDLCAAGFGAPHIRQRLFWVAGANGERINGCGIGGARRRIEYPDSRGSFGMANTDNAERRTGCAGRNECDGQEAGRIEGNHLNAARRAAYGVEHAERAGLEGWGGGGLETERGRDSALRSTAETSEPDELEHTARDGRHEWRAEPSGRRTSGGCSVDGLEHADLSGEHGRPSGGEQSICIERDGCDEVAELRNPGPVNGFWRDADWLLCRSPDGEPSWRAVEPGTFPLVNGYPGRMGCLRAYGNAISPEPARHFIQAYLEATGENDESL